MVELCYAVFTKKSGEEILRGYGKFDSMEDFYSFINFRYGYTSKNYHFLLGGREIQ